MARQWIVTAKVNWESSSTGVIIPGTGLVSAMAPGIVSVTANLDGITSPAIILRVVSAFQVQRLERGRPK